MYEVKIQDNFPVFLLLSQIWDPLSADTLYEIIVDIGSHWFAMRVVFIGVCYKVEVVGVWGCVCWYSRLCLCVSFGCVGFVGCVVLGVCCCLGFDLSFKFYRVVWLVFFQFFFFFGWVWCVGWLGLGLCVVFVSCVLCCLGFCVCVFLFIFRVGWWGLTSGVVRRGRRDGRLREGRDPICTVS